MVDKPIPINSVTKAELCPDGAYRVFLNMTMEDETFDGTHVFRVTENMDDSAWAPWLMQEIEAGNIQVVPYVHVVNLIDVNFERDRRKHLDITFAVNGVDEIFQANSFSQQAIQEAAGWAQRAIDAGVEAGDYHWKSPNDEFQWILENNTLCLMDAPEMVALWEAVSSRNERLQLRGRELKNMSSIPLDYENDSYWA